MILQDKRGRNGCKCIFFVVVVVGGCERRGVQRKGSGKTVAVCG